MAQACGAMRAREGGVRVYACDNCGAFDPDENGNPGICNQDIRYLVHGCRFSSGQTGFPVRDPKGHYFDRSVCLDPDRPDLYGADALLRRVVAIAVSRATRSTSARVRVMEVTGLGSGMAQRLLDWAQGEEA